MPTIASESTLSDEVRVYEELVRNTGQRTLEILEHRRKTATVHRRGWLVRRLLVLADVSGLLIAFALAEKLTVAGVYEDRVGPSIEYLAFAGMLPVWIVMARLFGLYDHDEERVDHSTADDLVRVFLLVTTASWTLWGFASLTNVVNPSSGRMILLWALAIVFVTAARAFARFLARRQLAYFQNAVIVGAGEVGQLVAHKINQHREYGINIVGFVDDEPRSPHPLLPEFRLLGSLERLPAVVRVFGIDRVIIAFSHRTEQEMLSLIRSLRELDVQIDIVPRLWEILGSELRVHGVEGLPLIGLRPLRLSRTSQLMKRGMDVLVSLAALVALAPLFALIGVLIRLDSPGDIFFRQVRRGSGDREFRICKFRTMAQHADDEKHRLMDQNMHAVNGGDPRMFKVPNDPRVTRVGRLLRRTCLDELPQLINVLKGEMSLVGPRPIILEEDRHVIGWARKRLDLKPGMTGLWQVLGASEIPFDEMTKLDYLYVTDWSLWGDLRLIFRTLPAVLRARRAY